MSNDLSIFIEDIGSNINMKGFEILLFDNKMRFKRMVNNREEMLQIRLRDNLLVWSDDFPFANSGFVFFEIEFSDETKVY